MQDFTAIYICHQLIYPLFAYLFTIFSNFLVKLRRKTDQILTLHPVFTLELSAQTMVWLLSSSYCAQVRIIHAHSIWAALICIALKHSSLFCIQ